MEKTEISTGTIIEEWRKDAYEIGINLKFELLKIMRSSKLWLSIGLAALLPILFYVIPLLSGGDFPDNAGDFISQNMNFVNLIIVFTAMLLASDIINKEHSSKTALILYPLPQRRTNILLSKYIVALISSWVSLLVYYVFTAISVALEYGKDAIPEEMVKSYLFAALYLSAVLSVGFLLSAWLKSPGASMTLTFFGVMIFLPITVMLLDTIGIDSSWIFTTYSSIITGIFRFPKGQFGVSSAITEEEFYKAVRIVTTSTVVFFLAALGIELRKEA